MRTALKIRSAFRKLGVDVGRWPRPHDLDGALATVLKTRHINLVLDVGGNRGQFGRRVRALGYAGRMVSFEPSPEALPDLEAAAERDGSWGVRPVALSLLPGQATLHRYHGSEFNSLHAPLPDGLARFPGMRPLGTTTVPTRTLAVERALACDGIETPRILLKSDTQGHDLEVIASDPGLPHVEAVLVELSVTAIYDGQPGIARIIETLGREGFKAVAFEPVNRAADRLSVVEFDGLFLR